MIVLFNKPYGVVSQFTGAPGQHTLAEYILVKNIYAAGRLDKDSEGLLLLTDDNAVKHQVMAPQNKLLKIYWAQVEGCPGEMAIRSLQNGVKLSDGKTRPAKVKIIKQPVIWPRNPPIRFRKLIPDTWLEIGISEGKNRQIRRMTAAVSHPCLRLVRIRIGPYRLGDLQPGEWRSV